MRSEGGKQGYQMIFPWLSKSHKRSKRSAVGSGRIHSMLTYKDVHVFIYYHGNQFVRRAKKHKLEEETPSTDEN